MQAQTREKKATLAQYQALRWAHHCQVEDDAGRPMPTLFAWLTLRDPMTGKLNNDQTADDYRRVGG